MEKLIDAHELWAQIYKLSQKHPWKDRTNIAFRECLDAIQFFPTVDAEPVVRCKDCKHRIPNPHGYTCKRLFKEVSLDDYCAWGERREDGSEAHEG